MKFGIAHIFQVNMEQNIYMNVSIQKVNIYDHEFFIITYFNNLAKTCWYNIEWLLDSRLSKRQKRKQSMYEMMQNFDAEHFVTVRHGFSMNIVSVLGRKLLNSEMNAGSLGEFKARN